MYYGLYILEYILKKYILKCNSECENTS